MNHLHRFSNRFFKRLTAMAVIVGAHLLLVSGCTDGNQIGVQSVAINTPYAEGATCRMKDDRGNRVYLDETPGIVTLKRGYGPLHIICEKAGFKKTMILVEERYPADITENLMDNVVAGMSDITRDVGKQYPETITVLLEPEVFNSNQEEIDWLTVKRSLVDKYQSVVPERNWGVW